MRRCQYFMWICTMFVVLVVVATDEFNLGEVLDADDFFSYTSNYNNLPKKKQQLKRRVQRPRHNKKAFGLFENPNELGGGLWPPVEDVALSSIITASATCGADGPEEYCKMIDAHPQRIRPSHCNTCDAYSTDPQRRHPIENAINSTHRWWQSPTLLNGRQFEQVTITIDLKQVHQVLSILIKSGTSPRPAAWILERSLDGTTFTPWQYFAVSDSECRRRYNLPARLNKHAFASDFDVICTTHFSKVLPLENGEMRISLVNGRPGARNLSSELVEFTSTRFVRLQFQAMHTQMSGEEAVKWMVSGDALLKRSFYSMKFINIDARFVCSGHSSETARNAENEIVCQCRHNTCGPNCERCCPMYNQHVYQVGTVMNSNGCVKCQCFGHATQCYYDQDIDINHLSINTQGEFEGGGVCYNCSHHTTGVNCERCISNYYRPYNIPPEAARPCILCDCDPVGSDGPCDFLGGMCNCRKGFSGPRCDECEPGHRGENCEKCLCNVAGTMPGGECESHCQCKLHVEGEFCDKCSPGYFGLNRGNAEGCIKCYCSGLGGSCESSDLDTYSYETLEGWTVTDISLSTVVFPTRDNETGNLVFGMYQLQGIESVYWQAPFGYIGNLLSSYGSQLVYKMSWVVVRGDTSGKPTTGPNLILFGGNGMKIAFGDETFHKQSTTMEILLMEDGWYHVPLSVKDIVTRHRRMDYRGDAVTRVQFMSVLSNVETILLRGSFHTDQEEAALERATMYSGWSGDEESGVGLVERCSCPMGYSGLSCEVCAFGYVRIYENKTNSERLGKCIPCTCNGHAASCDAPNGKCSECLHNTFGERCERCATGYYGNPIFGTEEDCKRCACPLSDSSNNFSPSCQLKELEKTGSSNELDFDSEYICTQCPEGYTGDHCEICDDGYFGTPSKLGSKCLPCPCNGEPCDADTGRCISCLGNTEGWRCERCKTGFFGIPVDGCIQCQCHAIGSISNLCDPTFGQCVCHPQFGGQLCNECELGFANISLNCPPCDCNGNGSTSIICNQQTGQCECLEGVEGLKCDKCSEGYHTLGQGGCEACRCDSYGSLMKSCNRQGQCTCRSNVTGRHCDRCVHGTWNLESGRGCVTCQCDTTGSRNGSCNSQTGHCTCKPGVGGIHCDQCLDGFYGFSMHGCKKCDQCDHSAYICDPDTGRCICPSLSRGADCQNCYPNSYGLEHRKGCKSCECDHNGSIGQSCDLLTGQCICREGFTGRRCDTCAPEYYGYPECMRCACDKHGTAVGYNGTEYECDDLGQCPCKELVTGLKCDTCRQATFGLQNTNADGCIRCFCFGRSQDCRQSDMTWGQIRMPGARNLSVEYIHPHRAFTQEYEYVVVIQMEGSTTHREDAEIEVMNGLNLIPSSTGNVSIGAYKMFSHPLYFQLPPQFFGDRISSYGGLLKFHLSTDGCESQLDVNILRQYPLVQIHSHNQLVLDYYGPELWTILPNASYSVPLREDNWRYHFNGQNITRTTMMTALQNVKHIFLRGTTWLDFTQVVITNVTLDTAIYLSGMTNNVAKSVEQCVCPAMYNGTSCQDPGDGYYRWKAISDGSEESQIDEFIGRSIPCNCNGRSEICDKETGHCINCRNNTGGINCEICAEGFYGDPHYIGCKACPCPETSRNYARGCTIYNNEVACICKRGYTGPLCDRCMMGFFGYPELQTGKCEMCDCDPEGIVSDECDEQTGQCNCKPGISGRRCDRCEEGRHILENHQCKICDNCTLTLLDRTDEIALLFDESVGHINFEGIPAPYPKLEQYQNMTNHLENELAKYSRGKNYLLNFRDELLQKMLSKARNINNKLQKLVARAEKRNEEAFSLKLNGQNQLESIRNMTNKIKDTISSLNNYGLNDHHIKLSDALKKAKEYLDDIEFYLPNKKEAEAAHNCARNSIDFWNPRHDQAQKQHNETVQLNLDLSAVKERLSDAVNITKQISYTIGATEDLYMQTSDSYDRLKRKFEKVAKLHNETFDVFNNSWATQSDVLLVQISDNMAQLDANVIAQRDILHKELSKSNDKFDELLKNILDNDLIPKAQKHADSLQATADSISQQFQHTKDGAAVALLASSAHKNISDAITAAREAANHAQIAATDSQLELYPKAGQSVIEKSHVSLNKSHAIVEDARKEINKIEDLEDSFQEHRTEVEKIRNTIWVAGLNNNNISLTADQMSSDAVKAMRDTQDKATATSGQMREVRKQAIDINNDIIQLKLKLSTLEPEMESKFGGAEENVVQALSNIKSANGQLSNMENQSAKNHEKFQKWNKTIALNLQELRDKIAKARHAADGIRVSVDSSEGINRSETNCIRSYIPHAFGLTTSTTIKMSLARKSGHKDSPLLFIQGENGNFIALELRDGKIRFLWNLGGGVGSVVHPTTIQAKDLKYDDAWYHIEANRTQHIGSITVKRMNLNGELEAATAYTSVSSPEHTRFMVTKNDRIWMGGVPPEIRPNELVNVAGLGVAVHQLYVDHKQIGLWNFVHSQGTCKGAMLGAQETSATSSARHFNGEGYSVVSKTGPGYYNKYQFAVKMTFKTLDENALLFLAVDEKNNRSISLTLHEGKVVFRIDYGGASRLEINTTKKYNNGQWNFVEAARHFTAKGSTENGNLKINSEEVSGSPTAPINSSMLPDFNETKYFLGGIPPGFKSGSTKAPGADHAFLGCMKDVQINSLNFDPLESSSYFGIEQSCKDVVTVAGFFGNGHIELPSHTLRKRANFGFVFRTLQAKCLLLLSAYPPRVHDDYDSKDIRGNYSVTLVDGRVNLWIDSGKGRIEVRTNGTFNDGEFHVISVNKNSRRIDLYVDDKFQNTMNLPAMPFVVNMPEEDGGLYIGGAPDISDYDSLAPNFDGLKGSIKDIVFNNQTVSFRETIAFTNAHIGRLGPVMGQQTMANILMKTEPIGKSFTSAPEGCHRVGSYSYEPYAFKFGDGPQSHSTINVNVRNLWQKNFDIKFDFRTFYPNGVIFIAPGTKEKQKHFVALILRDGSLNFIVRGRRKEEIVSHQTLNNGEWHSVRIQCIDRKLFMRVDDEELPSATKIPKRICAANMLYVGGITENELSLPGELILKQLEEFKGCIRRLVINNTTQDLARPGMHRNVGQCFPRVEKGSYFPGDAYAIYKNSFNVGKYLEMELEFRTSELNGVLLSVSEPNNFPAMSIEMHNGRIVMSCDLGDGIPFSVETNLPSKYALCDYRWHNISVLYDSEEITLRIDNELSVSGLSPNRTLSKVQTKSPLYIGGLPETAAAGTLKSRDNFKGCIRNIVIRNEIRDWTDMDLLHNVLLSECLSLK